MILNREALTGEKARTIPRETVEIPALGGEVWVKGMTGTERDAFEQSCRDPKGKLRGNVRARLVVATVQNDDGSMMFTENDIPFVGRLRVDILQPLFNKAQQLSGLSDADVKELGEGSDEPAAGSGSSSSSLSSSEKP